MAVSLSIQLTGANSQAAAEEYGQSSSTIYVSQNIDDIAANQLKLDIVMQKWSSIGCLSN